MYAADEVYDTAELERVYDLCDVVIEGDYEDGHWTPVRCRKVAVDGERCAEHKEPSRG